MLRGALKGHPPSVHFLGATQLNQPWFCTLKTQPPRTMSPGGEAASATCLPPGFSPARWEPLGSQSRGTGAVAAYLSLGSLKRGCRWQRLLRLKSLRMMRWVFLASSFRLVPSCW